MRRALLMLKSKHCLLEGAMRLRDLLSLFSYDRLYRTLVILNIVYQIFFDKCLVFKKSIFTFAAALDDTSERAENPKDT